MDGNYARTLALRMECADMVIWLDFPQHLLLSYTQALCKKQRKKNPHGNPDRLDFSFLCFVWNYKKENDSQIKSLKIKYQEQLHFIHIHSGQELKEFMKKIKSLP